jgi:hypothetical protein
LILKIASYTYGPLLGLFAFGILLKRRLTEFLVPFVCVLVPVICFFISKYSQAMTGGELMPDGTWKGGYIFGNEMLILNGLLTFLGLYAISKPAVPAPSTTILDHA